MQDKIKKIHAKKAGCAGLLLAALLILGGCTKKEELLLIDGETSAKRQKTAVGDALELSVAAAAADAQTDSPGEQAASARTELSEETVTPVHTEPDVIWVHVCGAVQRPGVYELQAGSRVYEAVQAAGGFTAEAERDYVNQAQKLSDGVKLVIPTAEEAGIALEGEPLAEKTQKDPGAQIGIIGETFFAGADSAGQAEDGNGRININTASETQLCEIPGIGKTRAAAIAAYREAHGAFQKPEDIMKVNGIKEGMYEKIKDSISVN